MSKNKKTLAEYAWKSLTKKMKQKLVVVSTSIVMSVYITGQQKKKITVLFANKISI